MASGVVVDYGVVKAYMDIRLDHGGEVQCDRHKLLMLRLSNKSIIVDEENSLKMKDVADVDDVFSKLVSMFPRNDCRYALYDCCYRTDQTEREDLVFIIWLPYEAPMRKKMLYAGSKSVLRDTLTGLTIEWQVDDPIDANDSSVLIEKLGNRGIIKELEGKQL
ncbi:cofilin-1-B-like [Alosa pseudoharengus]|uniref:cofilin-1-B-like n=1 Tax=Alosa pseudoharengus TaxID=34774 RepID=UPI003F88A1EF